MARVAMYTCKREIFHCAYVTCGSHLFFFCFFFRIANDFVSLVGIGFHPFDYFRVS